MLILICVNIIILIACFILSKSRNYKNMAFSALNPTVFISFLSLFFILDFYYLSISNSIDLFEIDFVISNNDVFDAFKIYTLFNIVYLFLSFYFSLFYRTSVRENKESVVFNKTTSKKVFWGIQLILIFIFIFKYKEFLGLLNGEVSRQVLFRGNLIIHVIFSMILPSFAIYVSNHQSEIKKIIFAFLSAVFFISMSGSRGNLLLLVIILLVVFSLNVKKINALLLFASIPFVAGVLLVTRYFFREAWRYDSILDFISDNGGIGNIFFSTAEISMADVFVTINIWQDELIRYPFESFLGGVMYPLPRSIFSFKPIGSGGVLTDLLSPIRWELTKSEIVTTGYGDLLMQFGVVGGLVVFFIMTFFWFKITISTLNLSNRNMVVLLPFLLWWPYMFIRADIFNMFGSIWSFLLTCIICTFIQNLRVREKT